MRRHLAILCCWGLLAAPVEAALPAEVTVVTPARFEVINNGRPGGSVGLRVGDRLEVIDVAEGYVQARYRNVSGRILAVHTNLPPQPADAAPPNAIVPVPDAIAPALVNPVPPPEPTRPADGPAPAIARALGSKLVSVQGGTLQGFPAARLGGIKFYGLYFSASWCGPCRAFTPELIDAYGKIRALYPEFEIVLVNGDRSAGEMAAYMRDDRMPWPALAWDAIRSTREITRYAGSGIPCLVLVDANGKVLSDSYRWGKYVGPDAVVADTWKILRDYRRTNPRAKS